MTAIKVCFEVCRCCLSGIINPNDAKSITSKEVVLRIDNAVLNTFLFLEDYQSDSLPQILCNICFENLQHINTFYAKCLESKTKLEGTAAPLTTDNNEVIVVEEIDEAEYVKDDEVEYICPFEINTSDAEAETADQTVKNELCDECEESFDTLSELASHKKLKHASGHTCSDCGESFQFEVKLRAHCRIKHLKPQLSAECVSCDKHFSDRKEYLQHLVAEHLSKQQNTAFECIDCDRTFKTILALNVHIKSHESSKPFKCDECDRSFKQDQHLKYHRYSAHGGPIPTSKLMTRRNESSHALPYKCLYCIQRFLTESSLKLHMRIHTTDRKYQCELCVQPKSFLRANHLKTHVDRVHLKKKPYVCEICGKAFAQKGDKNIHVRRHKGLKNFICDYCHKGFVLLKALKVHLKIHTGESIVKCESCNETFSTNLSLKAHNLLHHAQFKTEEADDEEVTVEEETDEITA